MAALKGRVHASARSAKGKLRGASGSREREPALPGSHHGMGQGAAGGVSRDGSACQVTPLRWAGRHRAAHSPGGRSRGAGRRKMGRAPVFLPRKAHACRCLYPVSSWPTQARAPRAERTLRTEEASAEEATMRSWSLHTVQKRGQKP